MSQGADAVSDGTRTSQPVSVGRAISSDRRGASPLLPGEVGARSRGGGRIGPALPKRRTYDLRPTDPAAAADPRAPAATLFFGQLAAVLAKDLRIEWRTKDALTAMLVFSFLVLVTFNFALDLRPEVMAAVGPGVLWVAVVFASTLGLGRTFAVERDQGTLDGLLMAPLDRGALFLATLVSN